MSKSSAAERMVLVVEDNPDDRLLLELAANEVCPEVQFIFVPDGLKALALLQGEEQWAGSGSPPTPQVVVVDARLPSIDGFTLVRRIRQLPSLPAVKLLLWTDGREPDFQDRAKRAGADYAMFKRGSFHELLDEVAHICRLARGAERIGERG